MNLLIDENLSPSLVARLAEKGVAATHVAHVGLAGATDPKVWQYAFEHDQVVVTVNASDFLRLAKTGDVHPGLIVFRRGGLSRVEQWEWLEPVIGRLLESNESLLNQAVILNGPGFFTIVDLPP